MQLLSSQRSSTLFPEELFPEEVFPKRKVPAYQPSGPELAQRSEATRGGTFQTERVGTGEPAFQVLDDWMTASTGRVLEFRIGTAPPEIVIKPSARPLLTDRVQATLERLLGLLNHAARRNFVPVREIEVSGFVDPEEDTQEVVVTQRVALSDQGALDYWEKLGPLIEAWIDFLPDELTSVVVERLAVEVRSDDGTDV